MDKVKFRILLRILCIWFGVNFSMGCTHTKDGTHVELIEMDGREAYVAGAVGIGKNKTLACRLAIQRAAKAVSHHFAQEHDDLGDELADELGAEDRASFLYGYVNKQIMDMPVQDISYDLSNQSCFATVRWRPPVFLKDALKKYATTLKEKETASESTTVEVTEPVKVVHEIEESNPNPLAATLPSGESSAPATAAAAVVACGREKAQLKGVNKVLGEKEANFNECKRRTNGDEEACYRYGLYVKKAEIAKDQALTDLQRCLDPEG